jgi:hypothetical protein
MAEAEGINQCAASYAPHDCYLWNHQHTHITPEYISNACGVCGKITGFMWRKWSKRILSLFTSEPDHYNIHQ